LEVFDFNKIQAYSYAKREKNVLYLEDNFKVRIIQLPPNGEMPECKMTSSVVFFIIEGCAKVTVDKEHKSITKGQCLITKPATLSILTQSGVKIMAIQISPTSMEND